MKPQGFLSISLATILLYGMNSCGGGKATVASGEDTASANDTLTELHADNDIAMTVRSVVDALKVGEPLDSTEYDFVGILTDGQGTPIYTDSEGAPGEWIVEVTSDSIVSIKNVHPGDLLPDDLREYILSSLEMNAEAEEENEKPDDDELDSHVYEFQNGEIRFEIRKEMTTGGIESPLMKIVVKKKVISQSEYK